MKAQIITAAACSLIFVSIFSTRSFAEDGEIPMAPNAEKAKVESPEEELVRLRDENAQLKYDLAALREELEKFKSQLSADNEADTVEKELKAKQPGLAVKPRGKSKESVESYLKANPDIEADIAAAMRKGQVVKGMTVEAAEISMRSNGKKMLESSKYYAMRYQIDLGTCRLSGSNDDRFYRRDVPKKTYSADVRVLTQKGDFVLTKVVKVCTLNLNSLGIIEDVEMHDTVAQARSQY